MELGSASHMAAEAQRELISRTGDHARDMRERMNRQAWAEPNFGHPAAGGALAAARSNRPSSATASRGVRREERLRPDSAISAGGAAALARQRRQAESEEHPADPHPCDDASWHSRSRRTRRDARIKAKGEFRAMLATDSCYHFMRSFDAYFDDASADIAFEHRLQNALDFEGSASLQLMRTIVRNEEAAVVQAPAEASGGLPGLPAADPSGGGR